MVASESVLLLMFSCETWLLTASYKKNMVCLPGSHCGRYPGSSKLILFLDLFLVLEINKEPLSEGTIVHNSLKFLRDPLCSRNSNNIPALLLCLRLLEKVTLQLSFPLWTKCEHPLAS